MKLVYMTVTSKREAMLMKIFVHNDRKEFTFTFVFI